MLDRLRRLFDSGRGDPRGTTPTEPYRQAGPDDLVETEGVVMAGPAGATPSRPGPGPTATAAGEPPPPSPSGSGETAPAHEWTSGYDGDDPVRQEAADRAARAVEADEAGGPTEAERG